MNFSNNVNKLFPLLSRSNEMADSILVENLYKDDQIKNAVDKAAKTSTALLIPVKLPSASTVLTGISVHKLSN